MPIGASLVTLSLNDELIESCIEGYQVRLGQVKHGKYLLVRSGRMYVYIHTYIHNYIHIHLNRLGKG